MDKQELIEHISELKTDLSLLKLLNKIGQEEFGTETLKFKRFKREQLIYYCNSNKSKGKYQEFTIKKKSGGERTISAPCPTLKMLQTCVNRILQAIYTPSENAYGFIPGRSIVEGAQRHIGKNYVFNVDLKDFFPSIEQARVWKRLQLPPFNFNQRIANIIAGLCCYKQEGKMVLPQGAPTSPILTNIVCDNLDRRLRGVAKRFKLTYTRYADDITFSSMHNVYKEDSEFCKELKRVVEGQNFRLNDKKTRLYKHNERQEVTGLTVNYKTNVSRKYVRELRVVLHLWETKGYDVASNVFIPHRIQEMANAPKVLPHMENVIDGKLNYLKMVKGENDDTYRKLKSRFDLLMDSESQGGNTNETELNYLDEITNFENNEVSSDVDIEELLKIVADFEQDTNDK